MATPPNTVELVDLRDLTVQQRNAIDMLVTGCTDREAAEAAGLNRSTVTKWRLYHPAFQAELEVQRRATWGAAREKLRSLTMNAVNTLEELMASPGVDHADRIRIAVEVLKLTKLGEGMNPRGETDADAIISKEAKTDPLSYFTTADPSEVEAYEVQAQAALNDTDEDAIWEAMDLQEQMEKAEEKARRKAAKEAKATMKKVAAAAERADTPDGAADFVEAANDAYVKTVALMQR